MLLLLLALSAAPAPYLFVDGEKIGTAKWNAALLEPGEVRGYFWRGEKFCVVQQDSSSTMRCFDSRTKKWGGLAEVKERAPFVPHIANSARFEVCGGAPRRCVSCYAFFDALPDGTWVGVDRNRLWRARSPFEMTRLETLSQEAAGALQARGFGGSFFGGARFFLKPTSGWEVVAAPVENEGAVWDPIPAAPHGWGWRNALVSPDQQFVAAFAFPPEAPDPATQGEWWVFRIAENR